MILDNIKTKVKRLLIVETPQGIFNSELNQKFIYVFILKLLELFIYLYIRGDAGKNIF